MPAAKKSVRQAVARVGAAKRWGKDESEVRRDLAIERRRAFIERVLEDAPPLSPEQREQLRSILQSAAERSDVDAWGAKLKLARPTALLGSGLPSVASETAP